MFNGSSNITIQGGTFIIADSTSLEKMGVNISQNSSVESNHSGDSNPNFCASHGRGLTPDHRNPYQEANAQVDSTAGSHAAENFGAAENSGASIYTSKVAPEYRPKPMATPSFTSEVKSCKIMSNPTSVRNAKPNDDLHAPQCLAIPQRDSAVGTAVRTRFRVILFVISLIILNLVHRHRLLATPTSVKSVGASRRNAEPNDDSHASLHSQCPISQSHNTVRSQSTFGNVDQLVVSLNLAHRHRLLATMLGHALTHTITLFPLSDPTISLWRAFSRSANYLSNLLQPG